MICSEGWSELSQVESTFEPARSTPVHEVLGRAVIEVEFDVETLNAHRHPAMPQSQEKSVTSKFPLSRVCRGAAKPRPVEVAMIIRV